MAVWPDRATGIVRKAALLAAIALVSSASAQGTYPNRQITIVVGFSAGGSTDIVARLLAEEMRKSW